jgi:hypothetical protein
MDRSCIKIIHGKTGIKKRSIKKYIQQYQGEIQNMFMITFVLNNNKESVCIRCNNAETAFENIDGNATIIHWEKLY